VEQNTSKPRDKTSTKLTRLLRTKGQGLVEYALILVLIAIVVIGILTLLGNKVSTVFSNINSGLS